MPQVGIAHPPNVEVLYIDVPVGGSLPLAPQQQTLLSRGLWKSWEEEMILDEGLCYFEH